jgi:tryptophanyl-tRNA synthetase
MRILSGIQPTGEKHLGNYIGAITQYVQYQQRGDAIYCVVDLHALTVLPDPKELSDSTVKTVAILLAAGLDPDRCILFVQSHVGGEHAELAWLLGCVASYGELERMTQFKEKSEGKKLVSSGLFTYPVLQAADILIYDTDVVPVGADQKQHLELARNLAERFNARFGETFRVPKPEIPKVGARIMDLQDPNKKMSTSSDNPKGTVYVLDPPKKIEKKIKGAVTDPGKEIRAREDKPGIRNLLEIYAVASGRTVDDLEREYEAAEQYGPFKIAVAEAVVEYLRPVRERYEELIADRGELERIMRKGAERARELAASKVRTARERMGCVPG